MTVLIVLWLMKAALPLPRAIASYTFTFLTLLLSLQASYAAPLILLAQNRQADRDRLTMEEDRRRAAMQKADTEYLAREIAAVRIALGEVATRDFLRSELNRLSDDLQEVAGERTGSQRRHDAERTERRMVRQAELELRSGDGSTPHPRGPRAAARAARRADKARRRRSTGDDRPEPA